MKQLPKVGIFRLSRHVRDGEYTGKTQVNIPATSSTPRCRKLFDTCEEAISFARELDREYRQGKWNAPSRQDTAPCISVREAIARWLRLQERRVGTLKKRPGSLATDFHRLKAAIDFWGDQKLSAITEEQLMAFQEQRLKAGRKPSTINSDVVAIGKVLRWAYKEGLIKKLPPVERIPERLPPPVIATRDEVARVVQALPKRLHLLVRLLAETGCRSGEAFNLTWNCVDEANGFITFHDKQDWVTKTETSKRTIPISDGLLAELQQLDRTGQYVFPGRNDGEPVTTIKKAFATAVKAADIRRNGESVKITPHSLRKAYATWMAVDMKVPQPVLQAMLGHAPGSTVTNKHYVGVSNEAKRQAVVSLPL